MIVFAHGLEGSPNGSKIRTLREAGFEVQAPDFTGLPLASRVALLLEATEGKRSILAGSSYGGLAACVVAARYPERFSGLLLCAPAFNVAEAPAEDPTALCAPDGLPTIIVHGLRDDVVPPEVSRLYRDRSGPHVRLWEVDDGHRLAESRDVIVEAARELHGE
ncbi:MAG: alpha/beta fold hydrolase [Planctomycetota bacterium]|jgi:pimeloyl-ACP methyl ester carboxylesterase